ncbi:ParB/RepB/Spo0J family partition protein [Pseudomonas putida]|uniref:ParB/RepB/Spo0J family partition protein n=1 Tax=Pseudomonas putida TaxID=303 RepID=UPI00062B0048|nr:ParB/RepB/Spo0J family partition protein [Pseudomonas putida]KKX62379.1 plasmid stablization protein ParB [Pseudomonas putida]
MTAIQTHRRALMHVAEETTIQLIPLDDIRVLNPRARNKQVFARLVENISALGLKRPITVAPTTSGTEPFEIVCGQGRFEAFQALGEKTIPCIVVSATEADRYLIGLVENLARRKHSNRELLTSIQILSDRGYTCQQIADKTCLDSGYIHGILVLLRQGEERLIAAVEKGWLSIKLAMEIARSKDVDLQKAMMEAYESGVLKGEQLMRVRRLIDKRKTFGKRYGQQAPRTERPTPQKLLHAYQLEVRRQKVMIKKSDINEQRLLIIVTTMRKLLADDYFRTLLRNAEMPDMPKPLADRIFGETQ